ncbi:MAG: helix-turn-helix transcriptional regulator [Saprospiraceae bacterium]
MTTLGQDITYENISQREKEVLLLIAYENTTNVIANKLYISHHTVISHRKNLMEKLEVKNVAGMIRRAFELDLLRSDSEFISDRVALA